MSSDLVGGVGRVFFIHDWMSESQSNVCRPKRDVKGDIILVIVGQGSNWSDV